MTRHATTPDWARFRAATVAGTLQHEIPRACELAWSWLDLAPDERYARVTASVDDEAKARFVLQALPFVRLRLHRDGGSERTRRIEATVSIASILAERFPHAVLPPAAPEPFRETLLASTPALGAAIHAVDIGDASESGVDTLERAIDDFARAGCGAPNAVAHEFAWWLATAWWTLGSARLSLGRIDDARAAFEQAAASYDQAADSAGAAAARERVAGIDAHRAGDFDAAADREVRALLERQDALGRARALARLAAEMGGAGDRFGAAATAERLAEALASVGYLDPLPDFDAASASWIDTACEGTPGTDLFARICEIATLWGTVLGARANALLSSDPAASGKAQRALARIPGFSAELFAQSGRAGDEAAQRFATWCPDAGTALDRADLAPALQRGEQLASLDAALMKLHAAAEKRPTRRHAVEAAKLCERAQALGSRIHVVRATLEEAHALLGGHRDSEALAAADRALLDLLGERVPALSAFTTRYERELYLTAVDYKARALATRQDDEAILALCDPVMRDIEVERARVSSPYQQSAFLATRAEIYEFVAAAAYRTGRLDTVLEVSELLKSRALLASRLGATDNELDRQFREANDALRNAAPEDVRDLAQRREWLATARAIARTRGRVGDLPQMSIAAVQQALPDDTAAVTWLFVGADALVVLAIRRDGSRPALVRVDPTVAGELRDYLACVTSLGQARPNYKRLVPRIDELVAALGATLLPSDIRNFIAGSTNLVLCPHRALHLFPFHAAPWRNENGTSCFLIERFCVRYVPNLTSLLVPWEGNRDGRVLAVGVAHFEDRRVAPLPNAAKEARAVANAHGDNGQALVDPTRDDFLSQPLASYRCLHFATHGSSVLAGMALDDPLRACIHFEDGPLTAWDVSALPLRAQLAVLAACHSGQRAIAGRGMASLPGDDLFGLAGAFFEAGVRWVLGALWPVHDETAKAIVVAFHRSYARSGDPANALADAVREHLAGRGEMRDVFFWAPFFVSSLGSG